jgi:hypothetical protein
VGDEFTRANCLPYCDIRNRVDLYYLHFILSMDPSQPRVQDLNRPPVELSVSFSLEDIRFMLRTKFSPRYALIMKFGTVGYNSILQSMEPFLLMRWHGNMIIIVILV